MNKTENVLKKAPKVYIIIINWNQEELTNQCILSLKKILYTNYEIVLVDNHSLDGSYEALRERFGREVTVIRNEKNFGFSEGNNIGIKYAMKNGCDYVCLLNNDTVVEPDFLNHLIKTAGEDPSIGIVGGLIYHFEPKKKMWQMGAKINFNTLKINFFKESFLDTDSDRAYFEADYISGCLMLAKASLIKKIGMLEPLFFNYFEDADWCMRAWEAGFRVAVSKKALIYHKVSAAVGPVWKRYVAYRNQPLFMVLRKKLNILYLFYYPWRVTKECIHLLITKQLKECIVSFFGFFDFLTGNFFKGRIEKVRKM